MIADRVSPVESETRCTLKVIGFVVTSALHVLGIFAGEKRPLSGRIWGPSAIDRSYPQSPAKALFCPHGFAQFHMPGKVVGSGAGHINLAAAEN